MGGGAPRNCVGAAITGGGSNIAGSHHRGHLIVMLIGHRLRRLLFTTHGLINVQYAQWLADQLS